MLPSVLQVGKCVSRLQIRDFTSCTRPGAEMGVYVLNLVVGNIMDAHRCPHPGAENLHMSAYVAKGTLQMALN